MVVTELRIEFPVEELQLASLEQAVDGHMDSGSIPIRFVVSGIHEGSVECEIGIVENGESHFPKKTSSIFKFNRRQTENCEQFTCVLVIPTGVGAQTGGHSGDGGAVARLFASVSDTLITHPNVVNGADINELPENGLYVEGSVIGRLLMGTASLEKVRTNRLLVILDEHSEKMLEQLAVNSVEAARATMGLECTKIVVMRDRAIMRAFYAESGRAVGRIDGLEKILQIMKENAGEFDAVALSTLINVPTHYHSDYFRDDFGVNPWGGVEAMLTHAISLAANVPAAHSPMMASTEVMNLNVGVVDPRKAAEAVSTTYLHSVLKGLHRSPRIGKPDGGGITAKDVSCLVIPYGCIGVPTLAAAEQGIPVIAVKDGDCKGSLPTEDVIKGKTRLHIAENYFEAAGIMSALRTGIAVDSLARPIRPSNVSYWTDGREEAESMQDIPESSKARRANEETRTIPTAD